MSISTPVKFGSAHRASSCFCCSGRRTFSISNMPTTRRASPWADVVFSALAHGAAWLTLALLAGILISLVIALIYQRFVLRRDTAGAITGGTI